MPGFANPQNLNRYSYVTNNPLRYTDPTGHIRLQEGPQQDRFSQSVADAYRPQLDRSGRRNNNGSDASPTISPLDEIAWTIEHGVEALDLIDLVEDGTQWARPAYRQIKYAIPLGGFKWGVDAGLQLYDDRNMNLTIYQRGMRAGVRFFESLVIDGLSSGMGLAAGTALQVSSPEVPVVPAGVGFVVGSYSTSVILDNIAEQKNPALFSLLRLGGP
jgi:hypothetical protein